MPVKRVNRYISIRLTQVQGREYFVAVLDIGEYVIHVRKRPKIGRFGKNLVKGRFKVAANAQAPIFLRHGDQRTIESLAVHARLDYLVACHFCDCLLNFGVLVLWDWTFSLRAR